MKLPIKAIIEKNNKPSFVLKLIVDKQILEMKYANFHKFLICLYSCIICLNFYLNFFI